jgi:hypothetical protein
MLAAPVLVAFYPPMTDLPYHEAAIAILRNFYDRRLFPEGLYVHNIGAPNQLFHLVGWALAYPFGSRWAVKLVVAGAVVAVPVCAARFARHVGANPIAALLVAPMSVGWLFNWGLIANLLGLAALLATLPLLDRYAERPTSRGGAAALGALPLLFLAHEAMMFVYAGAALLFALAYPLSWKKTSARLAPFAAAGAITLGHIAWQRHLLSPAVAAMPRFWHPLLHKLERIPFIVLPASDPLVQLSMLALCAGAVGSFLWLRTRERRAAKAGVAPEPQPPSSRFVRLQRWVVRHRWGCFSAGLFAAYLAFPLTLSGATLVYQRWFPPAFAAFVVSAAPRDLWVRPARIARVIAMLLPVATLLVAWPSFADSGRAYQTLEQLMPLIEPGSAIAELDLGPGDPSRTFSMGPSGGRVLATRGGRLDYAFTDSPISPVVIPRRYQWNESLIRLGFDSWAFRPAHDFKSFRYVLVRTSSADVAALAQIVLAPEGKYVQTAGEWVLFESTLPVIPPASRPLHLPKPPPEELRDRAASLVERMGGVPTLSVPPEPAPDAVEPNGQRF